MPLAGGRGGGRTAHSSYSHLDCRVNHFHQTRYHHIESLLSNAVMKPEDFKSHVMFKEIERELQKNGAQYVKKMKGVFRFEVKGGPGDKKGVWIVDVKHGTGSVKFDPEGKGDVTLTIQDEDLLKITAGKLKPQQAFFQGKMKLKGNMGLVMKLKDLIPAPKAKL